MSTFPDWLEGARAAPSRYNSQPWRFAVRANGDVDVGWDDSRLLPASDPTSRDLFLSLGGAVESACLRAAAAGKPLVFVPAVDADAEHVGRLVPTRDVDVREDKRLAPYLAERRTARTPHLQIAVPPVVQLALRRETVGWGCRLHIESDRTVVQQIAVLVRRASIAQYGDRRTRTEMSTWYRLTPTDMERYEDGVTAECLDLHGLMLRLARRRVNPEANGPIDWSVNRILALREWNMARRTGAYCLLTAQSSDREDMVRAGRLLIRLWLLATEAGLSTHAVSPILQSPALSERCLQLFKAQETVPACLFRLGFTPPVAASPRLSPAQLLRRAENSKVRSSMEAHH
jgi:hypothetical protein